MLWWTRRKLASADPTQRARGIDDLAESVANGSRRAIELVVGALADPDSGVAMRAATVLGHHAETALDQDAAIAPVITQLNTSHDDAVRGHAVSVLASAGRSLQAKAALMTVVADRSDPLRAHAIRALIDALIGRLPRHTGFAPTDAEQQTAEQLLELIGQLTDPALLAEIALAKSVPGPCILAAIQRIDDPGILARLGKEYQPRSAGEQSSVLHLAALKRHTDVLRRQRLARIPGGGSQPDDETLVRALRHPDIDIREAAAAELKERKWQPQAAADQAWYFAVRGLWSNAAAIGAEAGPALIAAIEAGSDRQAEAIRALGRTRSPLAFEVLTELVASADWEIRRAAVQAFGELGDARAGLILASLLRDSEQVTQYDHEPFEVGDGFVNSLKPRKVRSPVPDPLAGFPVVKAAVEALVRLRPPGTVQALITLAVDTGHTEGAVLALRRLMSADRHRLNDEDIAQIAALPPVFRTVTQVEETGYRDPEGGVSGWESVEHRTEVPCDDLRQAAQSELKQRHR